MLTRVYTFILYLSFFTLLLLYSYSLVS